MVFKGKSYRQYRDGPLDWRLMGKQKVRDKATDVHLINTIKQLKERLNAAERNIKERSTGSKRGSNLAEPKEKDGDTSETRQSEANKRKDQLIGLAEPLSNFKECQSQLKQRAVHTGRIKYSLLLWHHHYSLYPSRTFKRGWRV
ncbi:GD10449 [Drosophila simulans]|uniref:GD10449 n=1 Tax=Drosophila simulans TaxID=7240 RepID=B4QDU8_DROSI|nr:GD10449 [Drosophila simulans]